MITLRELLKLINFRVIESEIIGMYHENSSTIRIYFETNDWFEFGIYDFGFDTRDKNVERILTKNMLDSEVVSINRVEELPILAIYINTEKSIDKH